MLSTSSLIGGSEGADFREPLQLMVDCHARIERFAAALLLVLQQEAGGMLLQAGNHALAEKALRYFRSASPLHTADEEESLFPRIRKIETPEGKRASALLDALESEHIEVEALLMPCLDACEEWLASYKMCAEHHARLVATLKKIAHAYHEHIRVENEVLFPLCAELLSDEDLWDIGTELAVRRGLDPTRLDYTGRCSERRMARSGTLSHASPSVSDQ